VNYFREVLVRLRDTCLMAVIWYRRSTTLKIIINVQLSIVQMKKQTVLVL